MLDANKKLGREAACLISDFVGHSKDSAVHPDSHGTHQG